MGSTPSVPHLSKMPSPLSIAKKMAKKMKAAEKGAIDTAKHPITAIKNTEKRVAKSIKRSVKTIAQIESEGAIKLTKKIAKASIAAETMAVKEFEVVGKVAHKSLDFVADNQMAIQQIINVTTTVIEVVGVVTGQPEIVAFGAALEVEATEALELAVLLDKAINTTEKIVLVVRAIENHERISTIMRKMGDVGLSAAGINGDEKLKQIGEGIHKGADIVDTISEHSKKLMALVKGKQETNFNLGKSSNKKISFAPAKKEKMKKKKGTRKPSKYNLHMKKELNSGKTFRQGVDSWNAAKNAASPTG